MPEQPKGYVFIFCSDQARNGKTLLCRLFASNLPNEVPQNFRIFDTDFPNGGINNYFPQNTSLIDFGKTIGRVKLFDSVIEEPETIHLIDLQSRFLEQFADTSRDIEFGREASACGLGLVVYYVLDKGERSTLKAHEFQQILEPCEFILVENDATVRPENLVSKDGLPDTLQTCRRICLPALSSDLLATLEKGEFTLFDFMAGREGNLPYEVKLELWNLLEFFYRQRAADSHGVTHFL